MTGTRNNPGEPQFSARGRWWWHEWRQTGQFPPPWGARMGPPELSTGCVPCTPRAVHARSPGLASNTGVPSHLPPQLMKFGVMLGQP